MRDDNCIFCKLANGVFPTNFIYEDDDFKVILDASPATRGHALILPKEHAANVYELDEAVAAKVLPLAKKLATSMKDKLGADGINLVQNNGAAAGQTVEHFHMHIIPRYAANPDNDSILGWNHIAPTDEEYKELVDLLSI